MERISYRIFVTCWGKALVVPLDKGFAKNYQIDEGDSFIPMHGEKSKEEKIMDPSEDPVLKNKILYFRYMRKSKNDRTEDLVFGDKYE